MRGTDAIALRLLESAASKAQPTPSETVYKGTGWETNTIIAGICPNAS